VKREWVGTKGNPCKLIANYFNLTLNSKPMFRYRVDVDFAARPDAQSSSKGDKKDEPVKNR
jgi:hypothetical protein